MRMNMVDVKVTNSAKWNKVYCIKIRYAFAFSPQDNSGLFFYFVGLNF
jgi:hypothetical protein